MKNRLDKLWRPTLKLLKQLVKISDNQLCLQYLDLIQQWVKICVQHHQLSGFEQLIRFLAQLAAPQQLKFCE